MNELNVAGAVTSNVVPALASVDVTANVTDAPVAGWRESVRESAMGEVSVEYVPAAIWRVDAVVAWVSALESVEQGISLHPHVSNALPDGEAYVVVCDPCVGVKRRCCRAMVEEE